MLELVALLVLMMSPYSLPVEKDYSMLKMCEDFAMSHSVQFSTDPNPSKNKTY